MADSIARPRKILQDRIDLFTQSALRDYITVFSSDEVSMSKSWWRQFASRKNMATFLGSNYVLNRLEYFQRVRGRGKTYLRKIPYTSVKNDIIRFANGVRGIHRTSFNALLSGTMTAQDWYMGTLFLTKLTLRAAFTVAEGGYDIFSTQSRMDRWLLVLPIFQGISVLAEKLNNAQRELNGRLLNDADNLADSIPETFENWRLDWAQNNGVAQGRRVLTAGENCFASGDRPGCVELAQQGWKPVWQVKPIGQAACYHKCRCFVEYRDESE